MLEATLGLDIAGAALIVIASRYSSIPSGMKWPLAIFFGIATSSVALIATLVLTGATSWLPLFWLIYLIPTVIAFRNCRWQVTMKSGQEMYLRTTAWLAGAAAILAICAVVVASHNSPYGGWDAWAIWNLKARFLYFGIDDGSWTRMFTTEIVWSHPDYPLLLPATIARYWSLLNDPCPCVPVIMSILVLSFTLLLIHVGINSCTGRLPANVSIIVLLSATFFIQHAGSQFADNFLALTVLAAAIMLKQLLVSDRRYAKDWGIVYLLGTILGFAASIKNEGLLITFVFLILYLTFIVTRRVRSLFAVVQSVVVLCFAWLLVFVPSLVMKYSIGVTNDVVGAISLDLIKKSLSWERISSLFQLVGPLALDFLLVPIIVCVGVVMACCGRFRISLTQNSVFLIIAPILIIAGYILVLWFTPHELKWHVETSFQRLLVQVWGALVFAIGSSISISVLTNEEPNVHHR